MAVAGAMNAPLFIRLSSDKSHGAIDGQIELWRWMEVSCCQLPSTLVRFMAMLAINLI